MIAYWLEVSVIFLGVMGAIQLTNRWLAPRLKPAQPGEQPFVSVLVPARNESRNIEACLKGLLAQTYPAYEVLVYDDRSEDDTIAKVEKFTDARLRLIRGASLPEGWHGKHHACHRLAEQAQGAWLLFVDADTTHQPDLLEQAIGYASSRQIDLMSAFVDEQTKTLGEKLMVPFPFWIIFSLLPMVIGRVFKWPAFTAANGQFMLFNAASYRALGGHAAIRHEAVDDMALARLTVKRKMRWRMVDATRVARCRMYGSFKESFLGFKKNYFGILEYRIVLTVFIWTWLLYLQWFAPVVLLVHAFRPFLDESMVMLAWTSVALMAVLWAHFVIRMRQSIWVFWLYPFIMTFAAIIGFVSMVTTLTGRQRWKGRDLEKPPIRWF
ncbi:MAG: glycosyltransferase [Acholeplasmatales bacterium]|nr:MAG: glycosyltransferase [Acholeplasmatales bacterium]